MNLNSKTIVVTGGGQGLGRAMALSLAKTGAKLALIDLNEEKSNSMRNLAEAMESAIDILARNCEIDSL